MTGDEAVFGWATVVSVNPLSVRRDGETAPLGVSPYSLAGTSGLAVGDRVWIQLVDRRALIVGRAGGPTRVETGPHHWLGFDDIGRLSASTLAIRNRFGVSWPLSLEEEFPLVVAYQVNDNEVRLEQLVGTISRNYMPYRIMTGRTSITPSAANTPTSVTVTFPVGRFTEAPEVIPSIGSSVVGTTARGVGVNDISTTSCRLWFTRTNTTTTSIYWVAVQEV